MRKYIAASLLVVVVVATATAINASQSSPKPSSTTSPSQPSISKPSGQTIDLAAKGLQTVSKDVLKNSKATKLDVSDNNLIGALPGEIRFLTNLVELDASNNKLTGIPAEIGQLNWLTTANFANNNLSGLPLEIGNLKQLKTLDLRGNPNISQNDISKIQLKIPQATIYTD